MTEQQTGGDLGAYLNRLSGGAASSGSGGKGAAFNPDDPPILVGHLDIGFKGKGFGKIPVVKKGKTKTYSQLIKEFYALPPTELKALQEKLYKAGFYGNMDREDIPFGDYDEMTMEAYKTALTRAANFRYSGVDITLDEMLAKASGSAKAGKAGAEKAKFRPQLDDPADLAAVFRVASTAVKGRVSESEVAELVEAYRGQQLAKQQQAYGLESENAAGTLPSMPNARAFVEDELRRRDPMGTQSHDVAMAYDDFQELLGGR